MTFHVAQKVVCINAAGQYGSGIVVQAPEPEDMVREGEIYTVRWCGECEAVLAVRLNEIVRKPINVLDEDDYPFAASRFRPIVEDRIAVFRQMLLPAPVKETERA